MNVLTHHATKTLSAIIYLEIIVVHVMMAILEMEPTALILMNALISHATKMPRVIIYLEIMVVRVMMAILEMELAAWMLMNVIYIHVMLMRFVQTYLEIIHVHVDLALLEMENFVETETVVNQSTNVILMQLVQTKDHIRVVHATRGTVEMALYVMILMNVRTIHAMKTLSVIIPLGRFLVRVKTTTLEMDLIALICFVLIYLVKALLVYLTKKITLHVKKPVNVKPLMSVTQMPHAKIKVDVFSVNATKGTMEMEFDVLIQLVRNYLANVLLVYPTKIYQKMAHSVMVQVDVK